MGTSIAGPLAPARPGDVDLTDAAHAVPVEPGADGLAAPRGRPRRRAARPGSRRPSTLQQATTAGCGRITSATSSRASPISEVTLCANGARERVGRVLLAQPRLQPVVEPPARLDPRHEHLVAPRIEQHRCSSWMSARMKSSSAAPDLRPDVAPSRPRGRRLAALDQLADERRVGLDRRWRAGAVAPAGGPGPRLGPRSG
jgi:hypothetical protein